MAQFFGRPRVKNSNSDPSTRTADGRVFDSKHEAKMYTALRDLMAQHPEVPWWLQPTFELVPAFDLQGHVVQGMKLTADFMVGPSREHKSDPVLDEHLVIDAKGMLTDTFVLRRKLYWYRFRQPYHCVKKVAELETLVKNHIARYYAGQ